MANIKIDNLANEIARQLEIYTEDVEKKVRKAENKVTKEAVAELKQNSPRSKGGGGYAEGWTRKRDKGRGIIIYNKTKPGLAHLLEHGHAKKGGGRVPGKAHIRPVENRAVDKFEALVEEAVQS